MTSSFMASFEGLWRRPVQDYKKGVQEYLVSLDTNVLLQLYRFTPDARNELLEVLGQLGERLWIPHHVAAEYYDRRVDAVKEHLALYTSVPKILEESQNKAIQELHVFAKRCSMSSEEKKELIDPIKAAFAKAVAQINRRGDSFDLSLERVINEDPVLESLAELLDGKTGTPFGDAESKSLIEDSKQRYEKKIPPGFKDASKSENAHGDFFVWEQLLREAKSRKVSVLFVTNDVKDDWVKKEAGLVIGAHPLLLEEFKNRCETDFMVTQLGRFLQIAKEVLGASVSASTVAQAENVRDNSPNDMEIFSFTEEEYESLALALLLDSRNWGDLIRDENLDDATVTRARDYRAKSLDLHATFMGAKKSRTFDGKIHIPLSVREWKQIELAGRRAEERRSSSEPSAKQRNQSNFSLGWRTLSDLERELRALTLEYAQANVSIQELEEEYYSAVKNSEGREIFEAELALSSARDSRRALDAEIKGLEGRISRFQSQMAEEDNRP